MVYDAGIIGTGPAGLSAALTIKLHDKSLIWFGNKGMSEKISRAEKVCNYPGMMCISGEDMAKKFFEQAEQMGLNIEDKMVTSIIYMGDHYYIMAQDAMYEAKTLVLATGVVNTANIKGEDDFLGKGVSYCATCDGILYLGKTIAVLSSSPYFEHEVNYLSNMANKVYFFPQYDKNQIEANNVVSVLNRIDEICGEKRVTSLKLKNGEELKVDGIFCFRSAIAPTTLLPGLDVKDGHIVVNRNMETNLPGCFAAGDCTGRPYQYVKAAGEGNIAAHSLIKYLDKQAENNSKDLTVVGKVK